MNRKIRLCVLVVVGLLVLSLAAGLGGGRLPQAQEPEPVRAEGVVGGPGTTVVEAPRPDVQGTAVEGVAPAGGVPEEEPELVSAYLRIAGTTFKPRQSDVEWGAGGQGGGIYASSGDSSTWFNTGVYLPQGSTVTMVRIYVHDTSASNCWAYFTIYDLFGDVVDEWGGNSSGIDGDYWFDITVPDVVIDYSVHSYVINWQPNTLGSTMALLGARIYYTPGGGKAYMPAVVRDGG